jgi:hypothetical protein
MELWVATQPPQQKVPPRLKRKTAQWVIERFAAFYPQEQKPRVEAVLTWARRHATGKMAHQNEKWTNKMKKVRQTIDCGRVLVGKCKIVGDQ